jgi:hypothetical protein
MDHAGAPSGPRQRRTCWANLRYSNVKPIVITDTEAILGIGDQGAAVWRWSLGSCCTQAARTTYRACSLTLRHRYRSPPAHGNARAAASRAKRYEALDEVCRVRSRRACLGREEPAMSPLLILGRYARCRWLSVRWRSGMLFAAGRTKQLNSAC